MADASDTLQWNARGNKFRKQADIDKLCQGNALSAKLYKDHLVSFDAGSLGALDGFCISDNDYFQVVHKGDKTLLSLTVEGQPRLVLDSIVPLLKSQLLALCEVQI